MRVGVQSDRKRPTIFSEKMVVEYIIRKIFSAHKYSQEMRKTVLPRQPYWTCASGRTDSHSKRLNTIQLLFLLEHLILTGFCSAQN